MQPPCPECPECGCVLEYDPQWCNWYCTSCENSYGVEIENYPQNKDFQWDMKRWYQNRIDEWNRLIRGY